jgi:hypothetical protein
MEKVRSCIFIKSVLMSIKKNNLLLYLFSMFLAKLIVPSLYQNQSHIIKINLMQGGQKGGDFYMGFAGGKWIFSAMFHCRAEMIGLGQKSTFSRLLSLLFFSHSSSLSLLQFTVQCLPFCTSFTLLHTTTLIINFFYCWSPPGIKLASHGCEVITLTSWSRETLAKLDGI